MVLSEFVAVEAPVHEEIYYVDGRPIPSADGLWALMEEALLHRTVIRNSTGNTAWYYQVGTLNFFHYVRNLEM